MKFSFDISGDVTYLSKNGSNSDSSVESFDNSTYHTYTIVWEPERVQFYIDGTMKKTFNETYTPPQAIMYLRCYSDTGWSGALIDRVIFNENREKYYEIPNVGGLADNVANYGNTYNDAEWFSANQTLRMNMTGDGFRVYVPASLCTYIVEVKDDGVLVTNLKFRMATRELYINATMASIVSMEFVDPPAILIWLYWAILPFGISIAPLIKVWAWLEKKHKSLPYIVCMALLIGLAFVIWQIVSIRSGLAFLG